MTRFIVEKAVGSVLHDRFEAYRLERQSKATGTAKSSLANPNVYDLGAINNPQRDALIQFWEGWQDELSRFRILDPSCGSGAFLIEAFDQLHKIYEESNERLFELRGHRLLFDPDTTILQNNLYGVDLNEEAVEICRLSLWIKTAARGKQLTSLDHTIRVGNSVVKDSDHHPRAFDWQTEFPEVFEAGGFDVVVGNPPYVRHESIALLKSYLKNRFTTYDGKADLYVYFYELGCDLLRPGGRLSFVVTNKWLKAGYAKALRGYLAGEVWTELVIDLGHAKEIFEDADVFPSILLVRKPSGMQRPDYVRTCSISRDTLRLDDLAQQVLDEGSDLESDRLDSSSWILDPKEVRLLLDKIAENGEPLKEYAGVEPLSGIKTGFNEAFLIDSRTAEFLISQDESSRDVIRPYLRGQDFARWGAEWANLWMLVIRSSENFNWPWATSGEHAETVFAESYPAVHHHLSEFKERLWQRQDQGRYWWELRSCAYWDDFDRDKIIFPEITWRPEWCLDRSGMLINNTAYFLPSDDRWILAVANSPVNWWYSWRRAMHGKDKALRFIKDYTKTIPIPQPSQTERETAERIVTELVELQRQTHESRCSVLDWCTVEFEVQKPNKKLIQLFGLSSDDFVNEIKKLRGRKNPISVAGLKALREEYSRSVAPVRKLIERASESELELSDVVCSAFRLDARDREVMWRTAPPRMPLVKED